MSNLLYLAVAVALSAVGLLVLWVRTRPSPSSPRTSVEQFNEKMRALSPDTGPLDGQHRRRSDARRGG